MAAATFAASRAFAALANRPWRTNPAPPRFAFRRLLTLPKSWIVVSAYTPQGFISNQPYDFGSILRMIEGVNHLTEGQLGFADIRATTDLSEFFTLTAPRACHLVPTATKALTADED